MNSVETGYGSSVQSPQVTSPPADPAAVDPGFANTTAGTSPQWTLDTDLAELSSDVYKTSGEADIGEGDWNRVDPDVLAAAGIVQGDLIDTDSSFQAAIYTDGEGRYVVAFAGTDPSSIDDWKNNIQQIIGQDSTQYNMALSLAQKAVTAFGADNVVFTGHSLGGGLASAASLATGNPAVTFNAAGLGLKTLLQVGLTPQQAEQIGSDGQIRRYNVENDFLTSLQEGGGAASVFTDHVHVGNPNLPDAVGYEITLKNPNGAIGEFNPKDAHSKGTVIEAMKARDIQSQENDSLVDKLLNTPFITPFGFNFFAPAGFSLNDIGQGIEKTWDATLLAGGYVKDKATDAAEDAWDATLLAGGYVKDKATDAAEEAWDATTTTAGYVQDKVTDAAEDAWDTTLLAGGYVLDKATDAAEEAWDATTTTAGYVQDKVTDAAEDAWDATTLTAGYVQDKATDTAEDVWDATTTTAGYVQDKATDAAEDAWGATTTTLENGADAFGDFIGGLG